MVITIDGETCTMKSTIAKPLAKRFSFVHISCGMIYRTLTHLAIKEHIDLDSKDQLITFSHTAINSIGFSAQGLTYEKMSVSDDDLEDPMVFSQCPKFSTCKEIIELVNTFIRNFAKNRNLVIDGRESGTLISPDADFKFYFTADKKRFEVGNRGNIERLDKLKKINESDKKAGIVRCPADATRVHIENFDAVECYVKKITDIIVQKIRNSIKSDISFALVPARGGSLGCPDKNIKKLNGHALIEYPIQVAKMLPEISEIVFTSDSPKYCEMAQEFGAYVPFLRPEELANPTATDLDFFTHAVYMLYGINKSLPEYFVFLRATSPLRNPEIVRRALNILKADDKATSIRTAHEAQKSPYKMFSLGADGYYHSLIGNGTIDDINVPRQILPKAYVPNGYVDIFKTENIIQTHTLYGNYVLPYETEAVIDIDTREDFNKAEKIIAETKEYQIFSDVVS